MDAPGFLGDHIQADRRVELDRHIVEGGHVGDGLADDLLPGFVDRSEHGDIAGGAFLVGPHGAREGVLVEILARFRMLGHPVGGAGRFFNRVERDEPVDEFLLRHIGPGIDRLHEFGRDGRTGRRVGLRQEIPGAENKHHYRDQPQGEVEPGEAGGGTAIGHAAFLSALFNAGREWRFNLNTQYEAAAQDRLTAYGDERRID
ncbi:MAG: hypothetical protein ABIF71_03200 [Planctomycetota bacterium]